jgi:hypothetical protein
MLQEMREELNRARAAAEKAAAASHRHQTAVAQLTGDNLVLVLRSKGAEDEAAALRKEREELRAAIDEQRGPLFDEVLNLLPLLLHFVCSTSSRLRSTMNKQPAHWVRRGVDRAS